MKKRVETTIVWDFTRRVGSKDVGIPTGLARGSELPVRINRARVVSSGGAVCGQLIIEFDCELEKGSSLRAELGQIEAEWHRRDWVEGIPSYVFKSVYTQFEMSRTEKSFCDAALVRMTAMFRTLGIEPRVMPRPKITQETFVWVPQSESICLRDGRGLKHLYNWVDFGAYMAARHGLAQSPTPTA